ncbi:kinase-like domain-containing protein [Suillus subalutaceus]|uniref:kinase-like domain-containing protein n=1 Tax=Suillus subalutaceus TaxID=48586 RepID=UPI001B8865C8|nr:kinase-like domain-containing protein [Suillus subalutaceus]KAG1837924.1 kinase-like domain-containing protein [Suillus subalutaceus]
MSGLIYRVSFRNGCPLAHCTCTSSKVQLPASAKAQLVTGIAEGLRHLHSENVIHGDLHPANVLIDGAGNPLLTDFGLATVVGDPELQWGSTTAGSDFNPRWRAPEVIGIKGDPELPTFESDIYSFGGVMIFVVSGDVPWKNKGAFQIVAGLAERANPVSARPHNILDNHWVLIQKCWSWDPLDRPRAVEVLGSIRVTGLAIEDNTLGDFTSQIFDALKLGRPYASVSFGAVYRCSIKTNEGTMEVAVKVLKIDPGRAMKKIEKAMRRELELWLRLSKNSTIVPLLGIAYVDSSLPALVSQWMSPGTLYMYLEQSTITASAKVELGMGVAHGLKYLHSEGVVHGDLHPANVLIDDLGNPRLTDFGLATVVGDPELQWGATTAARELNVRWRAPEVIGLEYDPAKPTFMSDIYSFGGVMFLILSGVTPWKEKKNSTHIIIELSKGATPARPDNIPDYYWRLIQQCWSWDPVGRPEATEVLRYIDQFTQHQAEIVAISASQSSRNSPSQAVSLHFSNTPYLLFGLNAITFGTFQCFDFWGDWNQEPPTLTHTPYEVSIGTRHFKLWEVSSIEPMGFFRTLLLKWRLKKSYKRLCRDDGVYLLLYCMRGSRAQRARVKDYKSFTDIVGSTAGPGRVPVAAVVTSLEDYPTNMDQWWMRNKDNVERLGMRFSAHACITSLPDDPHASPAMRGRRRRSEEVIRTLLYQAYQTGSTPVSSNIVSAS